VYQQVSFEGTANAMSELDVGPWPAGMDAVAIVNAQQQARTIQGDERGCLQLMVRILDETSDLPR
jgi:hypothetical protein